MSDIKMERLLNLTMALLATRRYLTKSEILNSVSGYSGSPESMDRMFERDKDDLRQLGIIIEVGSLDLLFDDELGYRIRPETFTLNLPHLTPRELAYISLASQMWSNTSLAHSAHNAFARLSLLGVDVADSDELFPLSPSLSHIDLESIWTAITEKRIATFSYSGKEREVGILDLFINDGAWYLRVEEISSHALKTFKVSRIESDLVLNKANSYASAYIESDLLSPQHEKLLLHFTDGTTKEVEDEFDAIRFVLSQGSDAILKEPEALRQKIVSILRERAK